MDHITANDRLYMGKEPGGYSGASIWNADSSCYLKQNMGLVWMGNDTYQVQYRYEWKTAPKFRAKDYFAVAPATDLIVHNDPRVKFTYKGSWDGKNIIDLTSKTYLYKVNSLSMGQGRQVEVTWYGSNEALMPYHLGYLRYYLSINNKYNYQNFIVYAQYYHGKLNITPSASIGASATGPTLSFSISAAWAYTKESHPMEVRATNKYYK